MSPDAIFVNNNGLEEKKKKEMKDLYHLDS